MKFEGMFVNFLDMPAVERLEFFANYAAERSKALVEMVVKLPGRRKAAKTATKQVKVTSKQLEALKKFGLV